MADAENKKEKKKFIPVEFEIQRGILKKIINSHKKFVGHTENNSLSSFRFELVSDTMKVFTTDGNRILKSVFQVNNISKENISFNVESGLIEKLVVLKSCVPFINVTVNENTITFDDKASGIIQTYKLLKHIYPDVEKLIKKYDYKKKNYEIGLNRAFFNDLSVLYVNDRTNLVCVNVNKKDNLQPVVVKTGSEELEQLALLMPVQIRK